MVRSREGLVKRSYAAIAVLLLFSILQLGVLPTSVTRAAEFNVGCSVTELINAINTANGSGEADTINLATGCTYTLIAVNNDTDGPNGLPSITSQITINGNGATIERSSDGGMPEFRISHVARDGNLTLTNITIANGNAGSKCGGGIYNTGTLNISNSTLLGNRATSGGGIYNEGTIVGISYYDYDNENLKYAYQDAFGWHIETVDSAGDIGEDTSLALDKNGYPHISYADADNNALKYAYQDATGWHIETVDSGLAHWPVMTWQRAIELDSNGYPHIVYHDHTNRDLKYAYKDGDGWHTEIADGVETSTGYYAAMVLDDNDYPHVSYLDATNGNVKYAYKDAEGWHTETACSYNKPTVLTPGTSIKLDSSGYPHIAFTWIEVTGRSNWVQYVYKDATGWHVEDVGDDRSGSPSLDLDNNDYPRISYRENRALAYAYKDGGGWHTETADSEGSTGYDSSLVLDSGGYPHVSYYNITDGDLKYAYKDAEGWNVETVDSEGDVGEYTSIALNINYSGTVDISNSTFSGNTASNDGGGILSNGTVDISNSTFSGNTATDGGGMYNTDSTIAVKNTIVAGNTGGNCSGTITSQGYNLESGTDCGFNQDNDLQNTDPKLGPLEDNEGPTWTHALLEGSPAIDAGSCTDIAGDPVTTDQRGYTRPSGGGCDIGAFEYSSTTTDLALTVDAPSALEVQEGQWGYAPNPFTVTATVTNTGNVAATWAFVTISLPISLTLEAGQSPVHLIGDLAPDQSRTVTWSVTAITQTNDITLLYGVVAAADNTDSVVEVKEVFIPGMLWSFAIITDLHIGEEDPDKDYDGEGWYDKHSGSGEDAITSVMYLWEAVGLINSNRDKYNIEFVPILGDLSDSAELSELEKIKEILGYELRVPWIPLIGNHDVWPFHGANPVTGTPKGAVERQRDQEQAPEVILTDAGTDWYFNDIFAERYQYLASSQMFQNPSGESTWDKPEMPVENEEVDPEHKSYFQNFAFDYRGLHFIGLDFSARDNAPCIPVPIVGVTLWFCSKGVSPEGDLHNFSGGTWDWFTNHLTEYVNNHEGHEDIILLAHHPFISIWDWPFFAGFSSDELKTIRGFLANHEDRVYAEFAGHTHRKSLIDRPWHDEIMRMVEIPANKEDGPHVQLVQVYPDRIDYSKILGYGLKAIAKSPVDLIIIDPDNLTISKDLNEIPGATYMEVDVDGDGSPDDWIGILERKLGGYQITVIPEPGAALTDTYTLEVSILQDGFGYTPIILDQDRPVEEIPIEPYLFESKERQATQLAYTGDLSGRYSDPASLSAHLADENADPLADKTIIFQVGGKSVSAVTNESGIATAALTLDQLPSEYYFVDATFYGDEDYLPSFDSHPFEIVGGVTITVGPDRSGDEGSPITFTAVITDPDTPTGHTIEWDFGDGAAASGTLTPTHAYADDGVYTVTLTVTDTTGLSDSDSLNVTVENVPPTVEAGPDQTVDEGEEAVFDGSFTDPGVLDTHTIAWDFGDGATASGTLTPTHVYADDAVYTVTLTVDDDGGVGRDTLLVTVNNVAPTVSAWATPTLALPRQEVALGGTFTDPGWLDTHLIAWDLGDGTIAEGSLATSHAYDLGGVYTATLTVTDDDGGTGQAIVPLGVCCELYPIALHVDTLVGVAVGEEMTDVYNGTGSGNFGWLSWTGAPSVPTLVQSLTPPGDSDTYVNPYDSSDHTLSVGDWVRGKPGVSNARSVRNALDALKTTVITVPVWDEASGQGSNLKYRVVGFARVQITDYRLPGQNRISAVFWGTVTCPDQ